ncbi:hypothetical protein CPC08DRAFT_617445, partial [Agrocybe pediades]
KYKPVAKKVHSVAATLPEEFRIVRRIPLDPLEGMLQLPVLPPEPMPGERYTQERMADMDINPEGFFTEQEVWLIHWIIRAHEKAFAWNESEKGHFREDYFDPIKLPVLPHTPWAEKMAPIPPGIMKEINEVIVQKVAAETYEGLSSS